MQTRATLNPAFRNGLPFLATLVLILCLGGQAAHAQEQPQLLESKPSKLGQRQVPDEVIVRFKEGTNADRINSIALRFGMKPLRSGRRARLRLMRIAQRKTVDEVVEALKKDPDVEYAEPNYIAYAHWVPNDQYYPYQWHMRSVNAEQAWDLGTGNTDVIVAVVDTGVAYEDYAEGTWWRRTNYYLAPDLAQTHFVPGYDFINNDTHPNDDNSHGTHVAGTIAQSTNNSIGTAGLASNVSIMPVKVLDGSGSGSYFDVSDGIQFAADNGAKVINMSLGGGSPSATLKNALEYAHNKGVTLICSAGNDGSPDTLGYPAAYDEYCVAVGATRYDNTLAYYSNAGPSLDVVAPGGDLNVDQNADGYGDGVLQQTFGSGNPGNFGYWFYQGTSMAAPHVTAAAALVISRGVATSPDDVRTALESTAVDLGAPGRDDVYGHGLIDAYAAMQWSSGPVDNPPTVDLLKPLKGATLSGTETLSASASDDVTIDRVTFTVDGVIVGTDTTEPYETSWNSSSVVDGNHTVAAVAYDSAGQNASDSVSVTVDNQNTPPQAKAGPDQTVTDDDLNGSESVTLNGSGSTDPDGSITGYEWFEGGNSLGTGPSLTRDFSVGAHSVTLRVTDDGGATDEDIVIITVQEGSSPGGTEIFADSFESGLWGQDSQRDWKRSSQRASEGGFSAEVDGRASDSQLLSIPMDLQGTRDVKISFSWYIESGLDTGEYLAFDTSTNGGASWTERARLRGNVDAEEVWHTVSVSLNGISSLRLRFRGTMSSFLEDANVDDVRVSVQ